MTGRTQILRPPAASMLDATLPWAMRQASLPASKCLELTMQIRVRIYDILPTGCSATVSCQQTRTQIMQVPGVLVAVLSSVEQGVADPSYRTLVVVANSRPSTFTLDWPAGLPPVAVCFLECVLDLPRT